MPPATDSLTESLLSIPLPRFRQPISDPDLPEVTASPDPETSQPETPSRPGPTSPDPSPAPPPIPSPDRPGRTRTFSAGDAETAKRVVAGLLAILCGAAFTAFARRGRHFRQPTQRDVDGVSTPLGRIIARHLPIDIIGPDLVDATEAVAAGHTYVLAGRIVTRVQEPIPTTSLEDLQ